MFQLTQLTQRGWRRYSENAATTDATIPIPATSSNNISQDDNKWFDQNAIVTNPYKKSILERLHKANDNLCIWGPWFGLLIIRLEERIDQLNLSLIS